VVVVVKAFAHAHVVGRLLRILPQMQIVPARGVFEHVNDTNWIAGLPAVLEPHVGDKSVNGIIERQLALVGQHKNR
jgi:hypothetical protein